MTTTIHRTEQHATQRPHPPITITERDLRLIERCIAQASATRMTTEIEALEAELGRATIVSHGNAPDDVVVLGAAVVIEDVLNGQRRDIRVVLPEDADASAGRISVLAPIGAAVIGLARGAEIEWRLPNRATRLRVVDVRRDPDGTGSADDVRSAGGERDGAR